MSATSLAILALPPLVHQSFLARTSTGSLLSKHLKGRSVPRVGDIFGSHFLGELLVTFLDHTFLASCW